MVLEKTVISLLKQLVYKSIMADQKGKKTSEEIFSIFECLYPKTHLIKALYSLDSSRPTKMIFDMRKLFLEILQKKENWTFRCNEEIHMPPQKCKNILLKAALKLVSTIFYQIFIFSPNNSPLKTMKKFFFPSKKLFSFSRCSSFCSFSLPFHTFQIQKGK